MAQVFISYRRSDAAAIAGRLYDRLTAHYGAASVFLDVDDIPPGIDFRVHTSRIIDQCSIVLAIVGLRWLGRDDRGIGRIQQADDPVRAEIELALNAKVPLIPILVDGIDMPGPADMPESLREFAVLNAVRLDSSVEFHWQVDRLIHFMDATVRGAKPKRRAQHVDGATTGGHASAEDGADAGTPRAHNRSNNDDPASAVRMPPATIGGSARRWLARNLPATHELHYRPSIAVLPLENMSHDPNERYFSDGIVEDIIVSLAGLHELVVVSRASSKIYGGRHADIRDVGRELGVRYVMTGSVRRSAHSMRVSVQLSDAQSGINLWADTSDVPPGELFDIQDSIVRRVVSGIAPQIREEELRQAMRRRPESMHAYHCTLQALHCMDYLTKERFAKARTLLRAAMEDDPDFAMPMAWAVWWYVVWVGQGWSDNPSQDAAEAIDLAERAVALDPRNALALAMHGHLQSYLFHNYDTGLVFLERARVVGPSNALAALLHALSLAYTGQGTQAVAAAEQALRLSPLDHNMFLFHNVMAWAHYAAGLHEQAAKWARSSASLAPSFTANLRILAGTLAALERHDEAAQVAARLLALEPDFRLERYANSILPFGDAGLRTQFLAHLRSAGLPS